MKLSKEKARENLSNLISKFEKETNAGRINDYNEEATKTGFIQPFLRNVLGWDVSNRDEVSPEEKISRGRVDYGLKAEGQTKLFIEVKPPKADLDKHIKQAVGYGYNRKSVPFVLLTDFEGLKLFDVTIKPDRRNPLKGLKIDLDWKEYLAKFDKIWLLSKESVLNGELDKLLLKKPKDRLPVDKAILDDLKGWREKLAKDIFKNNSNLFHSPPPSFPPRVGEEKACPACPERRRGELVSVGGGADYLKEITQRIIDRIMFMRSCEDRKLIHRRPLRELFAERTETVGTNTMVFLGEEFKHYNIIFDSDLFRPQDWETNLAIDFKVMKDIIMDTYNPYQFDVIPLEVLGNMYEQYLGYTIRLTDHQVKYELKPDVRKAGGVYYTPEYIVDYIVKNTVGKLLQELPANRFLSFRTKRGISSKTKKLRILDPACGSGSFLIRAYEEMLNYYKNQKKKKSTRSRHSSPLKGEHNPQNSPHLKEGGSPDIPSSSMGEHNPQNPPPLKGEGSHQIPSPLTGEGKGEGDNSGVQRVLSLQDGDIEPVLTIEEKSKILQEHIFGVDIDEQAVEVTKLSLMLKMLEGEFGIIPGRNILPMLDKNIRCGNSLISGDTLELKKYFGDDWYKVKAFNWKDAFRKIMVEEGGFDVVIGNPPYVFARDEGFKEEEKSYFYQKYKLAQYQLNTYIMFTEESFNLLNPTGRMGFIIPNNWLTIDTTSFFRKFVINRGKQIIIVNIYDKVFQQANVDTSILLFSKSGDSKISFFEMINEKINPVVEQDVRTFVTDDNYIISYDLLKSKDKMKLCKKIAQKSTYLRNLTQVKAGIKAYEVGKGKPKQTDQMRKERVYHSEQKIDETYLKYLDGRDVQRYFLDWGNKYIKYGNNLAAPRVFDLFKGERLLIRQIPAKPPYSIHGSYADRIFINDLNSMVIKKFNNPYNIKFLLGVINSRIISFWFFYKFGKLQRKIFPQFKIKELSIFPIRNIDFTKIVEKKLHDNIVALVDVMLDLNKKLQTAKGSRKEQIERQIEKTDREIDDLVYKLYGITEEEKKIIEGGNESS